MVKPNFREISRQGLKYIKQGDTVHDSVEIITDTDIFLPYLTPLSYISHLVVFPKVYARCCTFTGF